MMENTKKIKELLTRATFEVFETMFFVFAEPLGQARPGYQIRARIDFSGPVKGVMGIRMQARLANLMAANMLNLTQDEGSEAVAADCVRECLNMICGNFARKLDPDSVFQLSIPVFERVSEPAGGSDPHADAGVRAVFDTEAGAFEVSVTMSDAG